MRSMWKQRAYTDASYPQTSRPEQKGQKGETAPYISCEFSRENEHGVRLVGGAKK